MHHLYVMRVTSTETGVYFKLYGNTREFTYHDRSKPTSSGLSLQGQPGYTSQGIWSHTQFTLEQNPTQDPLQLTTSDRLQKVNGYGMPGVPIIRFLLSSRKSTSIYGKYCFAQMANNMYRHPEFLCTGGKYAHVQTPWPLEWFAYIHDALVCQDASATYCMCWSLENMPVCWFTTLMTSWYVVGVLVT